MHVLVVEDDRRTADFVRQGLREAGHTVDVAADGATGLNLAETGGYDVLVVDRMLPARDGLEVVASLRETGVSTPVLFLTALGGVGDRVEGLEKGGDDYLVKPFAFSELLARVQALGRRPPLSRTSALLSAGDLQMDLRRRLVSRGERRIEVTAQEFRLLEFLLRHAGQVVTRTMLLEGVWGLDFEPRTNVVDAHISRLRAKIDKGFEREVIKTVRGVGYMIDADA
jgi:two-component system OmpR family response regulator